MNNITKIPNSTEEILETKEAIRDILDQLESRNNTVPIPINLGAIRPACNNNNRWKPLEEGDTPAGGTKARYEVARGDNIKNYVTIVRNKIGMMTGVKITENKTFPNAAITTTVHIYINKSGDWEILGEYRENIRI